MDTTPQPVPLDHDTDCPARDACECGAQGIREWVVARAASPDEGLREAAERYAAWEPNEFYNDWPAEMKADRNALRAALASPDLPAGPPPYPKPPPHNCYCDGRLHKAASPDGGLREALIATLKRDDLCDDTEGEHHTDEFIAAFLMSLDTEMRGRTALASPAAPVGTDRRCSYSMGGDRNWCSVHGASWPPDERVCRAATK